MSSSLQVIKNSATGRWLDILPALSDVSPDALDGQHHPCPRCGGKDRFRLLDAGTGALFCNQCFSEKNGDGIAALQWLNGWTFPDTLDRLADHLGLERPKRKPGKPKKKTRHHDDRLEFRPWNPTIVALWARHKGEVTIEAVEANGGQIARWRGQELVIAFPILSPKGKVTGRVIYNSTGRELAKKDGTTAKIMTTGGSRAGWIGKDAIDNLKTAEVIWKTEGPSDLLALWSRIPTELRGRHVAVSNAFGAKEKPKKELTEIFRGKRVMIAHDQDDAGQTGAGRWAEAIAAVASETRVVQLPDEGSDLRDYLDAGHSYGDLATLAKGSDITKPPPGSSTDDEADEADNDPSRLGREFVRKQAGRLACYLDQIYYWEDGRWAEVSPHEFRSDVTVFMREEFHGIAIEAQETAKSKDEPPPKVHKITTNLVRSVMDAAKAYACVSDRIQWGTLLERNGALDRTTAGSQRNWIAVENGILQIPELLRGKSSLREHSPDWFSPHRLPYKFDPKLGMEDCPSWQNFLDRNLAGAEDKISLLQEWAGYCLTADTSQQKFLILEGEGANGKSVYCAVLEALLGEENVSHVALELFGQRFALTSTLGKLANIATEIGELDKVAEGFLKSFTGGEAMTFDRKNKAPIDCKPTARLILATNNRPRFSDSSHGLWRRISLVPFEVEIPQEERVLGMEKPEWWRRSGEMPAILNWALDGLVRLSYQGRFTDVECVREAIEDYKLETNPAREFLLDAYEAVDGYFVATEDLYSEYAKFCERSGYHKLGIRRFGREIQRAFKCAKKTRPGSGMDRRWGYDGITKKITWTEN